MEGKKVSWFLSTSHFRIFIILRLSIMTNQGLNHEETVSNAIEDFVDLDKEKGFLIRK